MQVVELAGVILALSMKVLVGIILVQPLKAISGEKTVWPGSHRFVAARKLHHLARPTLLGVLAPVERPKDANVEVRGQEEVVRVEG